MSGTNQWGANNHQWKGDNIGYHSLHKWLRHNLPKPEFCELCGKKPARHIANISGEYNRSFDNYLYICYRCHRIIDGFDKVHTIKYVKASEQQ